MQKLVDYKKDDNCPNRKRKGSCLHQIKESYRRDGLVFYVKITELCQLNKSKSVVRASVQMIQAIDFFNQGIRYYERGKPCQSLITNAQSVK
jgi:hypothetical protein